MALDPQQAHIVHEWQHTAPLIACRFDPQGRFLFTSAEDYTLQRWDLSTGEVTVWEAHDSWVNDLACLPDGETLISAGGDDKLIFWSATAEKPELLRSVDAHKGWVRTIAVSPDGSLVATGGNDHLVRLWNASDGKLVRELAGHESDVYSTLFHPAGDFLLSGELRGKIKQWDVNSGDLLRTFDAEELLTDHKGQRVLYGGVRSLAFSPEGNYLAACGLHKATNPLGAVNEPLVLLYDWESGEKLRSQPAEGTRGLLWRVVFLSDGSLLGGAGGSGGGFLLFFNTDEEKPFHTFKLPDTLRGMDLHPDGLQVATMHFDRRVRISRLAAKTDDAESKDEDPK